MKNKKANLKNNAIILALIFLIFCIAVVLTLLINGTFAAYTNSTNAQRTVAPYDMQGERFSSGVLLKGESEDNVQTCYVTNESDFPSKIITVCNYEYGKQTKPFTADFGYTITARFVRYDGETRKYTAVNAEYLTGALANYTATFSFDKTTFVLSAENLSASIEGSFTARESKADVYTLTFCNDFVANQPNLYVEVVATTDNVWLHPITGIFKTGLRAAGATNSWEGAFDDDTDYAPRYYDGFNYRVTGVGKGRVEITWDGDTVDLSDESFASITGATKIGFKIIFNVDSDEKAIYDFRFYKKSFETDWTTIDWTAMNNSVVKFKFYS